MSDPTEKEVPKSHKIDLSNVPVQRGSTYPAPHGEVCKDRLSQRLGLHAGLTHLGVNRVRLPPGAWSSQRHWHTMEEEFAIVLEGEVVLVTDDGEEVLRAGDCVAFKGGVKNGHCAQNRSDKDAVLLAVSARSDEDGGEYSDLDMKFEGNRYAGQGRYVHKDGTPY